MLRKRTLEVRSQAGKGFQGVSLRQVREPTAKLGCKTVSLYQSGPYNTLTDHGTHIC